MRLLADSAGDALSVLTLEAVGNEHQELCRTQSEGLKWIGYYTMNAQKLADLRLEHNLTDQQMRSAIAHEVPFHVRRYEDGFSWWNTFWDRSDDGKKAHYLRKDLESAAFIRYMSTAAPQELAERVLLKETMVVEHDRIEASKRDQRLPAPLITRNGDLYYVFVVNKTPGLYLWTVARLRRYDFDRAREEDDICLRWSRGPETDAFNTLTRIVEEGHGSPHTFPAWTKDIDYGDGWDSRCYARMPALQRPNHFAMPYELDLPNLEVEKARFAKKKAWEKRQIEAPKKSRKALRHERWVKQRHETAAEALIS